MPLTVVFSDPARSDLRAIVDYVLENDGAERAEKLLLALREAGQKLAELPSRGHVVKELRAIANVEFREIHYKPYRIIYEIMDGTIVIQAIFDGRRDLRQVLEERLLRG